MCGAGGKGGVKKKGGGVKVFKLECMESILKSVKYSFNLKVKKHLIQVLLSRFWKATSFVHQSNCMLISALLSLSLPSPPLPFLPLQHGRGMFSPFHLILHRNLSRSYVWDCTEGGFVSIIDSTTKPKKVMTPWPSPTFLCHPLAIMHLAFLHFFNKGTLYA